MIATRYDAQVKSDLAKFVWITIIKDSSSDDEKKKPNESTRVLNARRLTEHAYADFTGPLC